MLFLMGYQDVFSCVCASSPVCGKVLEQAGGGGGPTADGTWTDHADLGYTDALIHFEIAGFPCSLIGHPLFLLPRGSVSQPGETEAQGHYLRRFEWASLIFSTQHSWLGTRFPDLVLSAFPPPPSPLI